MDSSSPINKPLHEIFAVILIVFVLISYGVRRRQEYHTVFDYVDTVWISEDPYFKLNIKNGYDITYLEINGELVRCHFIIPGISSHVLIADYESPQDIYLEARCKYLDDRVIMKIERDNRIYGGKYDKIMLYLVE